MMSTIAQEEHLVTWLHLPHAIILRLHVRKIDVAIFTSDVLLSSQLVFEQ